MERRRIEYPGAFYHVIQRGNNRELIFRSDTDKSCYLNNLVELKSKFDFKLLGYVLMDNHYHLLLQTGEDPLNKIIFRQNMYYSRYFNKSHNRSGHIYGGRYKASLIQDERYAFAVLRYIHWNPVKAGITNVPEKYPWSSDTSYRKNQNSEIDIDLLLNTINPNNRNTAIEQYIRMMRIEEDVQYDSAKVIGNQDFIDSIISKVENEQGGQQKQARRPLDEILKAECETEKDFELIKSGSRKRSLGLIKAKYIEEAVKEGYSYEEIGKSIGITDSAVALYLK